MAEELNKFETFKTLGDYESNLKSAQKAVKDLDKDIETVNDALNTNITSFFFRSSVASKDELHQRPVAPVYSGKVVIISEIKSLIILLNSLGTTKSSTDLFGLFGLFGFKILLLFITFLFQFYYLHVQ